MLFACFLLVPLSASALQITTTEMEMICGGDDLLTELSRKYGEQPVLMGDAQIRKSGQNQPVMTILYTNPKTGSYTILLKIDDRYCVMAAGSQLVPVQSNTL